MGWPSRGWPGKGLEVRRGEAPTATGTEDAGRVMMEGAASVEILDTRPREFKVQSLHLSVTYMACATDTAL